MTADEVRAALRMSRPAWAGKRRDANERYPSDLLTRELWLARRLREHGAAVFDGVTDRETRRDRVRQAILAHGLETVIVGRREGKPCTYAEAFELVYGEPLVPGNKRQPPQVYAAPKKSTTPAPSRLSQSARGPQRP